MQPRNPISLLIALILLITGCGVPTTTTCPNCMNVKPAYYNKQKSREARKMTRRADKHSATGTVLILESMGTDKKTAKEPRRHKIKEAETEIQNEPILN